MPKKDKKLQVYMTEGVYEAVKKEAKAEMMSASGFIMWCVAQELKKRKAWEDRWS
jgi:hypothetical protein